MSTRHVIIEFTRRTPDGTLEYDANFGVKWWQPVYVFNPRHASSYVCRVPRFMADMIIKGDPGLDWWPNVEGDA